MVPQERQPGGGLASRVLGLDHVLADRVLAGRGVVQKQQVVANLPGSPEEVLAAELSDQLPHLLGEPGVLARLGVLPMIVP